MNAKPRHESINVETSRTCFKGELASWKWQFRKNISWNIFFFKVQTKSLFRAFFARSTKITFNHHSIGPRLKKFPSQLQENRAFCQKIPEDLHSSPFSFIPSSFGLRIYSSTVSAYDRSFYPTSPNHRSLIPIGIRLLILTIDANKFN